MQHYGLPTRLLDWSLAPTVAAFFASDLLNSDADGTIWVLQPTRLNTLMLKLFKLEMPYGYDGALFFDDATDPVRRLVDPVFVSDELGSPAVLAVVPQEHDRRVTVQQSMFTLHGSTSPLEIPNPPLWGTMPDDLLVQLLIPAQAKVELRRELALLGINRASLFPDLDNLAKQITETHETAT